MTLQQQSTLEQWAAWLDNVMMQALKPYEGRPSFPKAARQFLLKWSFYRYCLTFSWASWIVHVLQIGVLLRQGKEMSGGLVWKLPIAITFSPPRWFQPRGVGPAGLWGQTLSFGSRSLLLPALAFPGGRSQAPVQETYSATDRKGPSSLPLADVHYLGLCGEDLTPLSSWSAGVGDLRAAVTRPGASLSLGSVFQKGTLRPLP